MLSTLGALIGLALGLWGIVCPCRVADLNCFSNRLTRQSN